MNTIKPLIANKVCNLVKQIPYLSADECFPIVTVSPVSLYLAITDSHFNEVKTVQIYLEDEPSTLTHIQKLESELIQFSHTLTRTYSNLSEAEQAFRCKFCMWHGQKDAAIEHLKYRHTPLYTCPLCDREVEHDPNAEVLKHD